MTTKGQLEKRSATGWKKIRDEGLRRDAQRRGRHQAGFHKGGDVFDFRVAVGMVPVRGPVGDAHREKGQRRACQVQRRNAPRPTAHPRLPVSSPTSSLSAVIRQAASTDTRAAQRFSALAPAEPEMAVVGHAFLQPTAARAGASRNSHAGRTPRHNPAMPKLYGVHDTSTKPAARIISSITCGGGKSPH